jgi:hypothetical protein
MNRLLIIFIILILFILSAEGVYYLKYIKPKNIKDNHEIIAVSAYPTLTTFIKKKEPVSQAEFISGAKSANIQDNSRPVNRRKGSLKGTITKVAPEGLTVKTGGQEVFYWFHSRVYLYLRNHPKTNLAYADIKPGQAVELNLRGKSDGQPTVNFIIIED